MIGEYTRPDAAALLEPLAGGCERTPVATAGGSGAGADDDDDDDDDIVDFDVSVKEKAKDEQGENAEVKDW